MKHTFFTVLLLFSTGLYAQLVPVQVPTSQNVVKVADTIFRVISPDKIFLSFVLNGKDKQATQKQEEEIKEMLVRNNFGLGIFHKSDRKETTEQNTYTNAPDTITLQLTTEYEVLNIAEAMKSFNIKPTLLFKSEYSELESLLEELKKEAIQLSKSKAENLFLSKGEKIQNPLESGFVVSHHNYRDYQNTAYNFKDVNLVSPGENKPIFEKIGVSVTVYSKYASNAKFE